MYKNNLYAKGFTQKTAVENHLTAASESQVIAFKNKQAAHKMRLLQHAFDVLNNPKFYKDLPDYTFMKDKIPDTLSYIAAHDISKLLLPNNHDIIKNLANVDGLKVRDLPDHDKRKAPAQAAISGITSIDITVETMDAQSRFNNPEQRKKIEKFLTMLDKNDVVQGRLSEFGGDLTKIDKATDYIIKMKGLTKEEMEELVRVGRVIEKKEFDYSKEVRAINNIDYKNFDSDVLRFFETKVKAKYIPNTEVKSFLEGVSKIKRKNKLTEALFFEAKKSFSSFGKFFTLYSYGNAIYSAGRVLYDPDGLQLTEQTLKVLGVNDAGHFCEGYICRELAEQCETKTDPSAVNWERCLDKFFSMPLEKQDYYLRDRGFNNYIKNKESIIRDIRCSQDPGFKIGNGKYINKTLVIGFDIGYFNTFRQSEDVQTQTLKVDMDNELLNYVGTTIQDSDQESAEFEKIYYNKRQPTSYAKCKTVHECNYKSIGLVQTIGLVAPAARRVLDFMEKQNDNLVKCCQSKNCQQYFSDKRQKQNVTKKHQIQNQSNSKKTQ